MLLLTTKATHHEAVSYISPSTDAKQRFLCVRTCCCELQLLEEIIPYHRERGHVTVNYDP